MNKCIDKKAIQTTLGFLQLTPINTSVYLIEAKDDDAGILYYALEPTAVSNWSYS